jgi:inhibitor of growth protein 3
MPMARSSSIHSTAASVAVVNQTNGNSNNVDTTDAGDADGDGDDRTYCFCDGVSYGEMIACDDENCEREWVIDFFFWFYSGFLSNWSMFSSI